METENAIREIIKPHFGHLKMYVKWVNDNEMTLDDVENFNTYIKSYKNIIKALSKPLNRYESYYDVMLEISHIEKDERIKRIFRNGLNGSSRKFFNETYEGNKRKYHRLSNDDFKLRVFFRNSSKPHNVQDYLIHLNQSLTFANDMSDLIKDVEDNYDYIRTDKGAYLFELTSDLLHIVPNSWCIYRSESDYNREILNRKLNSIWLLIDPHESNPERKIVGIDVQIHSDELLYMNTLNNRFSDNVPIYSEDFFRMAGHRLRNRVTKKDVTDIIKEHLRNEKIKELEDEKLKSMVENQPESLMDIFFKSKY